MGKAWEHLSITTVTTTQVVPCCLVDVVKLCHWTVEHLLGKSRISNDNILSQLHLTLSPVTMAYYRIADTSPLRIMNSF